MYKEYVIIGEKYRNSLEAPLLTLGLKPLFLPENPFVDKRLSGHTDLSVFYAGDGEVFLAPYLEHSDFSRMISKMGLKISILDILQSEKYPNDAQMNVCTVGKHFIFNPKVSDNKIVDSLINKGFSGIPVKQGYAKCSICPTGENSLITSDPGISKACAEQGMDVLQISPGFIALEGFECGFIGGCTFMPDSNLLAFTGNINAHPDCNKILEHLDKHGLQAIFLTREPIFDIGSFVII